MGVQKRMNQLFESALARTEFETQEGLDSWSPVCDAYQTRDALVLCLELPGLEQEQIELRLDGDELVVEGERQMSRHEASEQFHRVERAYGRFARRFRLPSGVDRDAVQASYRDGVLRVTLPRHDGEPPGSVRVSIT
jgi:HSP20 family protein